MFEEFISRALDGHISHDDTEIYAYVSREIANGLVDQGLWTKACVDTEGTGKKAKLTYIKYRAEKIKSVLKKQKNKGSKDKIIKRLDETKAGIIKLKKSLTVASNNYSLSKIERKIEEKTHQVAAREMHHSQAKKAYRNGRSKRKILKFSLTAMIALYITSSLAWSLWDGGIQAEILTNKFSTLAIVFPPILSALIMLYIFNLESLLKKKLTKRQEDLEEELKELMILEMIKESLETYKQPKEGYKDESV